MRPSTRSLADYEASYSVVPELATGGARHDSLSYAARIEAGLRSFLEGGSFTAFTTNFEDLGGLRQLPGIAVQRLMAEGYGFGAEGDWKTSALVRILKVMGQGQPGGTSFMEDYTYHLGPGEPKILGAHMLEVCPTIAARRPACEIHPLGIGNRSDPVRLVFDALAGKGFVVGLVDLGDRFRLVANEIEIVPPDAPLPKLPVARAVWKPAPSFSTATESWLMAGGPHHTALSTAVAHRVPRGLRRDRRYRARPHHRLHDHRELQARASLESGVLSARPGLGPLSRDMEHQDPVEEMSSAIPIQGDDGPRADERERHRRSGAQAP